MGLRKNLTDVRESLSTGKWTLCKEVGTGLLLLGAICIVANEYVALAVGGPGFIVLMIGAIGSILTSREPLNGESSEFGGMTDLLPNTFRKVTPPMLFYGPSSWWPWAGSKQPDITFRVGIAIPGVLPQRGSGGDTISQLHGEERENVIETALNNSPITEWMRSQRATWHWEDKPSWRAYGNGYPESTEYRFIPTWHNVVNEVYPFSGRTSVVTGTQNDGGPAIQVSCDVFVNILCLDRERQIVDNWKDTGEIPALAAFSLTEAAEILLRLWSIVDIAAALAPLMLPEADYSTGEVGMWFAARSVSLGRALNLSNLRRLEGSGDSPDPWATTKWPINDDGELPHPQSLIVNIFHKMLEESGYRGLSGVLENLRDKLTQ